ncbi:hypothetical protein BHE74_00053194 [Ensete ventricosum]|nr:hypothetical protein GW17_00043630 [Ensete ventricosum]RWW41328.1 hypothetical protein BHE74_00053194 [Ensete ventricosum]RZS10609.1 hypothetical protein BHM03_00041857 [Ensete ventricosum]
MGGTRRRRPGFRAIFNALCALVLFFFFFLSGEDVVGNRFIRQRSSFSFDHTSKSNLYHHRRMAELSSINSTDGSAPVDRRNESFETLADPTVACIGIHQREGFLTQCDFLKAHRQCTSGGLIGYISFFYCDREKFHVLGYAVLGVWLAALFYMLGNTAADYFCCRLGKLPPTVSGVTLLPLGNGAPMCLLASQLSLVWVPVRLALTACWGSGVNSFDSSQPLWGWNEQEAETSVFSCSRLSLLMEMPLAMPRRLTIPIVEEERWSKPYAVASAFLAPILLAFVFNTQETCKFSIAAAAAAYAVGGIFGAGFSVLAFVYTSRDRPPQRYLLVWGCRCCLDLGRLHQTPM